MRGFQDGSLAGQQGLIHVGDELLAVEGADLRGKGLAELVAVLKGHAREAVQMRVRRHKYRGAEV